MQQIGYAVETINVHPTGGGTDTKEAERRINEKIEKEGWDSVKVEVMHLNRAGDLVTSAVVLYVLTKNVGGNVEDGEVKEVKAKRVVKK